MKSVIEKFIDELKAKEDTLGILIFGSYARGDQRENSDVDVLVITKDSTFRDVEIREGQAFEMVYACTDDAKSFYEKNPDNAIRQWTDGRIVFDPKGEMEDLKSFVEKIKAKGKKELTEKQKAHFKFDAEDRVASLESMKEVDPASANFNMHLFAQSLMDLYYSLKKEWVPAPKQSLKALRVSNPEMAKEFDAFYTSSDFNYQLSIIVRIIKRLFE